MRELYKMDYVGKIKIEDLIPEGYKVSFYLDRSENPLVILSDLPDEKFLPYIKEELRSKKLHKTKYFGATKTPAEYNYETRLGIDRQDRRSNCGTCLR